MSFSNRMHSKRVHDERSGCSGVATWRVCPFQEEIYGDRVFDWICDRDYYERCMDI